MLQRKFQMYRLPWHAHYSHDSYISAANSTLTLKTTFNSAMCICWKLCLQLQNQFSACFRIHAILHSAVCRSLYVECGFWLEWIAHYAARSWNMHTDALSFDIQSYCCALNSPERQSPRLVQCQAVLRSAMHHMCVLYAGILRSKHDILMIFRMANLLLVWALVWIGQLFGGGSIENKWWF